MHGNRVWTLDEEAADLLLWFGADVIWGPGPVMMQDGQYLVNGIPQDPAGFPCDGQSYALTAIRPLIISSITPEKC